MVLPVDTDILPMEALSVPLLPKGGNWRYEPKWDGFRCLVFKDGDDVRLQSKSGKPLARYFPDIVAVLKNLRARRFALDGELVLIEDGALSFSGLQLRLHPAASRVAKLAAESPATLILFDMLVTPNGRSLVEEKLAVRRAALEKFYKSCCAGQKRIELSPQARTLAQAKMWMEKMGGSVDGIIAKDSSEIYHPGERIMQKYKNIRTADCVVGGFRYGTGSLYVGSLLLGLYDDQGLLHHVGFCSSLAADEKPALTRKLEKLIGAPGFTGKAPGGPSRWSTERSTQWQPLKPKLVVEVAFDHISDGRFRHGTRFVRWRLDKNPSQCRMEQIAQPASLPLAV